MAAAAADPPPPALLQADLHARNTYITSPAGHGAAFNAAAAERAVKTEVAAALRALGPAAAAYDPAAAAAAAPRLADAALAAAAVAAGAPRHTLFVLAQVGERRGQEAAAGSRCLWHAEHDRAVSASAEGGAYYAAAQVFAFYYE